MTDILALAEKESATIYATENANNESFTVYLGAKSSGKSTLLSAFLHPSKEESAKPTVGLEYSYGKRSGGARETAHIWELGGGCVAYSDLLSIVLTPARLPANALVFVVDLSCPFAALQHMAKWLGFVRAKVADIMERLSKAAGKAAAGTNMVAPDILLRITNSRLRLGYAQRAGVAVLMPGKEGEPEVAIGSVGQQEAAYIQSNLPDHPDAALMASTVLPFPCLFVANKYDAIKEDDSTKRKTVYAALRYLALCHGAHLVVTSNREKQSLAAYRSLAGQCTFGAEYRRAPVIDINKPLYIPAGTDTLESIGLPVSVSSAAACSKSDVTSGPFETRLNKYLAAVKHFYPPTGDADLDEPFDPSATPPAPASLPVGATIVFNDEASKHPEPVIDMLRVSALEETAKYVREQERKLRMEAKASSSEKA